MWFIEVIDLAIRFIDFCGAGIWCISDCVKNYLRLKAAMVGLVGFVWVFGASGCIDGFSRDAILPHYGQRSSSTNVVGRPGKFLWRG